MMSASEGRGGLAFFQFSDEGRGNLTYSNNFWRGRGEIMDCGEIFIEQERRVIEERVLDRFVAKYNNYIMIPVLA